jgi:hypothetical protein
MSEEIIKPRLADIKKLQNLIVKYYENIKNTVSSNMQTEIELLENVFSHWPKKIEKIYKIQNIDTIEDIFQFYESYMEYYNEVEYIMSLFNTKYSRIDTHSDVHSSQADVMEIIEQLDKVNKFYAKFQKTYQDLEVDLLENSKIIQQILSANKEQLLVMFETIQKCTETNTVQLYLYLTEIIIAKLQNIENNYTVMSYIYESIDADKSKFIEHVPTSQINNKIFIPAGNPLLKRYNLVPITDGAPLKQVLSTCLNVNNIKGAVTQTNLKFLAGLHKCTFVTIQKVVYEPIDYSVNNLFSESKHQKTYGLTLSYVEKMKTIKELLPAKWDFSKIIYSFLSDEDLLQPSAEALESKYFVFETLDGENYKILSCSTVNFHNVSNNFSKTSISTKSIPYNKIKNLLIDILGRHKHSRINSYQHLCIEKALPNMFMSRKLPLEYAKEDSKSIDTSLIKTEISIQMMKLFGKSKIKNNYDMIKFLQDSSIEKCFVNTIIEMFAMIREKTVELTSEHHFRNSEILVSYISELQDLGRIFMRDLSESYSRDPIIDFNEQAVQKKFEEILRATMNYLISSSSNIYQNVSYKNTLLSFSEKSRDTYDEMDM